jgi:hypothetical protein
MDSEQKTQSNAPFGAQEEVARFHILDAPKRQKTGALSHPFSVILPVNTGLALALFVLRINRADHVQVAAPTHKAALGAHFPH